MCSKPSWLPEQISIGTINTETFEMLYNIFKKDFIVGKPKLDKRPVFWDRKIEEGYKYENGFWHLIERKDYSIGERALDVERAEKLPWCAPSILNFYDPIIRYWEYQESRNRINIYVWLVKLDYVIIFEKKYFKIGEVAFLNTAFHIDGDSKRRNLETKYLNRIT